MCVLYSVYIAFMKLVRSHCIAFVCARVCVQLCSECYYVSLFGCCSLVAMHIGLTSTYNCIYVYTHTYTLTYLHAYTHHIGYHVARVPCFACVNMAVIHCVGHASCATFRAHIGSM